MQADNSAQLLRSQGVLSDEDIQRAHREQAARGGRFGQALVRLGILTEGGYADTLAMSSGRERLQLAGIRVDQDAIGQVDVQWAMTRAALPFDLDREVQQLLVATVDPCDAETLDELRFRSGLPLRVVVATETELDQLIRHAFFNQRLPSGLVPPQLRPFGVRTDDLGLSVPGAGSEAPPGSMVMTADGQLVPAEQVDGFEVVGPATSPAGPQLDSQPWQAQGADARAASGLASPSGQPWQAQGVAAQAASDLASPVGQPWQDYGAAAQAASGLASPPGASAAGAPHPPSAVPAGHPNPAAGYPAMVPAGYPAAPPEVPAPGAPAGPPGVFPPLSSSSAAWPQAATGSAAWGAPPSVPTDAGSAAWVNARPSQEVTIAPMSSNAAPVTVPANAPLFAAPPGMLRAPTEPWGPLHRAPTPVAAPPPEAQPRFPTPAAGRPAATPLARHPTPLASRHPAPLPGPATRPDLPLSPPVGPPETGDPTLQALHPVFQAHEETARVLEIVFRLCIQRGLLTEQEYMERLRNEPD